MFLFESTSQDSLRTAHDEAAAVSPLSRFFHSVWQWAARRLIFSDCHCFEKASLAWMVQNAFKIGFGDGEHLVP